ncbi:hypothetical protein GYMLUDRAFT_175798, partial [Collybiopsis luxurians FD-317 M1]
GKHFYLAAYDILVQSNTNTFVLQCPEDYHAISLQSIPYFEKDRPLIQCGLSIVTSAKLSAVFH